MKMLIVPGKLLMAHFVITRKVKRNEKFYIKTQISKFLNRIIIFIHFFFFFFTERKAQNFRNIKQK